MRIGTYNVFEFRYGMGDVLDTLLGMRCDVVGLQEVPTSERGGDYYGDSDDDDSDEGGKGSHLDGYLEEECGARVVTARASQGIGNTLLIKGDSSRVKRIELWRGSWPMRSAAVASVASDIGRVNVCSVHLDDQREMVRLDQFKRLEAELDGRGPSIVFGDFNALRESDYGAGRWSEIERARSRAGIEWARHELMAYIDSIGWIDLVRLGHAGSLEAYADSLRRPLPVDLTRTSRFDTRVDYIFATESLAKKLAVTGYEVVRSGASDHRPVVVELALAPKAPKKRVIARGAGKRATG